MSPLIEEMPDRAEESLPPLEREMPDRAGGIYYLWVSRPKPVRRNRSYLAVRLWLANAFVCLFLYVQCRLSGFLLCRWFLLFS